MAKRSKVQCSGFRTTAVVVLCVLCVSAVAFAAIPKQPSVGLLALDQIGADLPLMRRGVVCKQQGSWDRSGGNRDFNNFVSSQPDGTVVLFDEQGPGCIYRIWVTGINNNDLKFFFNDEEKPRIDTKLQDFFNGKVEGFPKPLVMNNDESSGGWCSYVPMPFAKRLRIVSNRNGIQSFYYNITFHRHADASEFRTRQIIKSQENEILTGVVKSWRGPTVLGGSAPVLSRAPRKTLLAGRTADLFMDKKGGSIEDIILEDLPEDPAGLRELVLRVYYDGSKFPSVDCPVGDFAGSPFSWTKVAALEFSVVPEARRISCYWTMPYKRGIRIALTNEGKQPVSFRAQVIHNQSLEGGLGYFHAQFRLVNTEKNDGKDLMILEREGRGHFVGCVQSVEGSHGLYFLEGDERVYVDDDEQPSLYGTGTEDYFNGGWYFDRGPFSTPTHGAPIRQNNGVISMYRLHLTDVIPFTKRIRFGIEHGHANEAAEKYGVVAFWYQDELKPLDSQLGNAEERRFSGKIIVPLKAQPGMIEAHKLKVLEKSDNLVHEVQAMGPFGAGWLGDDQLWIPRAAPGSKIVLELPVEKDGKYQLLANFTKARDYGKWRVTLDDKKLVELDLYNPEVIPTDNVELGTHELKAGAHRLTLECIGANDASVGVRYMCGLDYVWLKPGSR